ncbi:MAG: hypothetical protein GX684_05745 [Ruminococcaceae bacterium]|nr:hypothetical protein [Oscillospiraceae bacterium]
MKKGIKIAIIIVLVLVIAAAAFLAYRHFYLGSTGKYIGAEAAKEIAFKQQGVTEAEVRDLHVDLEKSLIKPTYYEVEFEVGNMEYEYQINAVTGQILKVKSEKDMD